MMKNMMSAKDKVLLDFNEGETLVEIEILDVTKNGRITLGIAAPREVLINRIEHPDNIAIKESKRRGERPR